MVLWFCNFPLYLFLLKYVGFFHYVVQRKQDNTNLKLNIYSWPLRVTEGLITAYL